MADLVHGGSRLSNKRSCSGTVFWGLWLLYLGLLWYKT